MAAAVAGMTALRMALEHPERPLHDRLLLAALIGLVPLISLTTHEFGHLIAAAWLGLAPRAVVLKAFSGGAVLSRPCPMPWKEALFALAGPAANLAFAAFAGIVAALVEPGPLHTLVGLVVAFNLATGVICLLPCFPLDGGLALRALRWHATGDRARATREAQRVGRRIGWTLLGLGWLGAARPLGWALMLAGVLMLLGPALAHRSRTGILDIAAIP
jgi:stage IV sporulation protein FB